MLSSAHCIGTQRDFCPFFEVLTTLRCVRGADGAGQSSRGHGEPKRRSKKAAQVVLGSDDDGTVSVYHSDEEIVVVGEGDDILFHQSSTSFTLSIPPPQSLDADSPIAKEKHRPEVTDNNWAGDVSVKQKRGRPRKIKGDARVAESLHIPVVGHAVTVPTASKTSAAPAQETTNEQASLSYRNGEAQAVPSMELGPLVSSINGHNSKSMPTHKPAESVLGSSSRVHRPPERFEAGPASGKHPVKKTVEHPHIEHQDILPLTHRTCYCGKDRSFVFFVACDKCNRWFHGPCIGVDASFVSRLEGGSLGYVLSITCFLQSQICTSFCVLILLVQPSLFYPGTTARSAGLLMIMTRLCTVSTENGLCVTHSVAGFKRRHRDEICPATTCLTPMFTKSNRTTIPPRARSLGL